MNAPQPVIRFPSERVTYAGRNGATPYQIACGRIRLWFGRLLNWVKLPGAIQSFELHDKIAGQHLSVSVGDLYVRLSVNGRDYYFHRMTGKLDGTGSTL